MDFSTLEDVQEEVRRLEGQPFREFKNLLRGIGIYLEETIPTHLDPDYLIAVERLLNRMYVRSAREGWHSTVRNGLTQALGWASAVSSEVKFYSDEPRSWKFGVNVKRLANAILLVSRL